MSDNFDFEIDDILSGFISETNGEEENTVQPAEGPSAEESVATEPETGEQFVEIKRKTRAKEPEDEWPDELIEEEKPRRRKKEPFALRATKGLIGTVCAAVSAVLLLWVAVNVHPATSEKIVTSSSMANELTEKLDRTVNNYKSDALSGITYIKKVFKIPESAKSAPVPNTSSYGVLSISNAMEINNVIAKAREYGLLSDDEKVVFDTDADFYYDSDIEYYLDESIMVICWKEVIDGNTCTFSEVKVADASQFRRKFVNDTFSADAQDYATNIARSVNAVVAMNADFYAFRDFGIVVYQRELFRFNEDIYTDNYQKYNCVDTLLIDQDGNFNYFHRLQSSTAEEMKQYIKDNNILFSVAFGPILVENGELQTCDWYPAGEVNTGYSRAGIGQLGELHYLYMSLNHSPEKEARWTVNQFAQHFYDKGVVDAYCLDGGQTSEIVFMDQPYNYIDFNAERSVTDIIYFATAIDGGAGL